MMFTTREEAGCALGLMLFCSGASPFLLGLIFNFLANRRRPEHWIIVSQKFGLSILGGSTP